MSHPSTVLEEKFRQLEDYVTHMNVQLLLLNKTQIDAWPDIKTEIISIVHTTQDTHQNLETKLTAVLTKITTKFADRKLDDDDKYLNQINTNFNMKFGNVRKQIRDCIQACQSARTISFQKTRRALLKQLKAL